MPSDPPPHRLAVLDGIPVSVAGVAGAVAAVASLRALRRVPVRLRPATAAGGLLLAQLLYAWLGAHERDPVRRRQERAAIVAVVGVGAAALRVAPVDGGRALAAAWAAHAVWDTAHTSHRVGSDVTRCYPPSCAVYDLVVAAGLPRALR